MMDVVLSDLIDDVMKQPADIPSCSPTLRRLDGRSGKYVVQRVSCSKHLGMEHYVIDISVVNNGREDDFFLKLVYGCILDMSHKSDDGWMEYDDLHSRVCYELAGSAITDGISDTMLRSAIMELRIQGKILMTQREQIRPVENLESDAQ